MADSNHLKVFQQGRDAWDSWRKQNPDIIPDLSEADLHGTDMKFANFQHANLRGAQLAGMYAAHGQFHSADLREADLRDGQFPEASFLGADLSNANAFAANFAAADFEHAKLNRAMLREAVLTRASFSRANLRSADLTEADMSFADMTQARLRHAIFVGTNLNGIQLNLTDLTSAEFGDTVISNTSFKTATGVESINHFRPSSIDIYTLVSSGELPSRFLQGLGLSDAIIDYLPSLLNKPIQFYSCFISYSVKDEVFAKRLHSDLQAEGVRCWFAPEDMKIGDRIRDKIDQSIRVHDKLLLVLSRHSIASDWVEKEVETAFELERKRKTTVLFPIRLDDEVMKTEKAWATDIRRTRHIGDFQKWKEHDEYSEAFVRLLRDLRASGVETNASPGDPGDFDHDIPF